MKNKDMAKELGVTPGRMSQIVSKIKREENVIPFDRGQSPAFYVGLKMTRNDHRLLELKDCNYIGRMIIRVAFSVPEQLQPS